MPGRGLLITVRALDLVLLTKTLSKPAILYQSGKRLPRYRHTSSCQNSCRLLAPSVIRSGPLGALTANLIHLQSIPIIALVDADPYGLDILSVYNYGSKALRHEDERLAADGKIKWLGVYCSELSRYVCDL